MRAISKNFVFIFFLFAILLAAFVLSGCGGSASDRSANSKLAFLQYSSGTGLGGVTPRTGNPRFNVLGHLNVPTVNPSLSESAELTSAVIDAYLLDVETGTATTLGTQSARYTGIQLSPDGTKVVFTANDSAGYSQIFVVDVNDFNNPRQLTSDDPYGHYLATFSPDGNTIGATRFDFANPSSSLITVPTAGGTVTSIPTSSLVDAWMGGFTRDGKKIILSGYGGNFANSGIYSMNLDGSNLTRLTNLDDAEWDCLSSPSPSGNSIVFTRYTPPNSASAVSNIYAVDLGGESQFPAKQLTTDDHSWEATFAGTDIAFVSARDSQQSTKNDNLYKMNAFGKSVMRLSNTPLEQCFRPRN